MRIWPIYPPSTGAPCAAYFFRERNAASAPGSILPPLGRLARTRLGCFGTATRPPSPTRALGFGVAMPDSLPGVARPRERPCNPQNTKDQQGERRPGVGPILLAH